MECMFNVFLSLGLCSLDGLLGAAETDRELDPLDSREQLGFAKVAVLPVG